VIVFSAQELDDSQRAQVESKAQAYHVKSETSPRVVLSEFMSHSGARQARAFSGEEEKKCAS
jgi:hypothetical protein